MNSGSEKKLSMDELLAMNRPTQATVSTAQNPAPPLEIHPTKEGWEEMMDCLHTLGYRAESQTGYLKTISGLLAQLPSRTQMDELLKRMATLEQMSAQAGSQNEKFFSLPRIKLPRLQMPHLDGPTWAVLLMALAALLLLWWRLGGVWSSLSSLLR